MSIETEYNLTWPIAVGMVHGRIMGEQLSPACFADQRILDLQKRISVEIADEFEKEFPGRIISEVIIYAKGKAHSSGPREAHWEAHDPPTDSELENKFISFCEPIIGMAECIRLINLIWKLATASSCVELFPKNGQIFPYSAQQANVHIHYL